MKPWLKKALPIILSVVGGAGVIGTAVLAEKAGEKSAKKKSEIPNYSEMKKGEKIKTLAPIYVPTAVCSLITISAIAAGTILSKKTEASLTATCLMLQQGWKKYKDSVIKVVGKEANNDILAEEASSDRFTVKDSSDHPGKELYWEEHIGYFWSTKEDIAYAYADTNQRLQSTDGQVWMIGTLKDFVELANGEIVSRNITFDSLKLIGWSADYLLNYYEYCWLHMHTDEKVCKDGTKYTLITFEETPLINPNMYDPDGFWKDEFATGFHGPEDEMPPIHLYQPSTSKTLDDGVDAVDPDIEKDDNFSKR